MEGERERERVRERVSEKASINGLVCQIVHQRLSLPNRRMSTGDTSPSGNRMSMVGWWWWASGVVVDRVVVSIGIVIDRGVSVLCVCTRSCVVVGWGVPVRRGWGWIGLN